MDQLVLLQMSSSAVSINTHDTVYPRFLAHQFLVRDIFDAIDEHVWMIGPPI